MSLTNKKLEDLENLIKEEEDYYKYNKLWLYHSDKDYQALDGTLVHSIKKYPKFSEFYEAGNSYTQRSITAANRVGKTIRALSEIVFHAIGETLITGRVNG